MARLREVARRAHVSLSVASRALTGDPGARISVETRQRVLDAAADLNYVPNHRARALRLSRAGVIALVVPDVNNAIFESLHRGVQASCLEQETAVVLAQLSSPEMEFDTLRNLVGNGRVDGVILQRSEEYDDDSLRRAIKLDVPVVLFNSTLDDHVGSVTLDDVSSVEIAVEHLATLGHTRIGFLGGDPRHDAAQRRKQAFIEQAAKRHIEVHESWVQEDGWEAPAGARSLRRILESRTSPTAVVAASMNAGVGAISAALEMRYRVPEQLSVVAIHDNWIARYMTPSLTTVALPMYEAGLIAGAMLIEHVALGSSLRNCVVSYPRPMLTQRASTGPALDLPR